MAHLSHIEFQLLVAATQYDMTLINNLINSLEQEQMSAINPLVLEEAMFSATKYVSIDPIVGASTIVTLMRVVGNRIPPEAMELALRAFPISKARAISA